MVTPETSGAGEPKRPKRPKAVALAMMGLAAGLVALIGLTQPDPPPTAETTIPTVTTVAAPAAPTTTVAFVAQGDPLEFEVVEPDGYPLALMESDAGEILVVQGDSEADGIVGVRARVSRDGIAWENRGEPIGPPNRIQGATVTSAGLVLYGQDGAGDPTLWISKDGRSWNRSVVDPDGSWEVFALGTTSDLMLTYGFSSAWTELERLIRDRFGASDWQFQTVYQEDEGLPEVVIHSPLGIPLAKYTVSELGMDPERFDQSDPSRIRATTDGLEWYDASLPEVGYQGELFEGHDGELWSVRHEDFTTRLFSTTDGLTWRERGDTGASNAQVFPWRGGLLSISADMRFRTSTDGGDWSDRTALRQLFAAPWDWYPQAIHAKDSGIALVATSTVPRTEEQLPADEGTVVVERDRFAVRISPTLITVFDTDRVTVLATIARWTTTLTSTVSFDAEAGTVTIHRGPESEPLVTFTIDELADIEAQITPPPVPWVNRHVLVTSPDGCSWTSQELALPSPSMQVYSTVIVGNRLALTVGDVVEADAPAEIWWAELPEANGQDCAEE